MSSDASSATGTEGSIQSSNTSSSSSVESDKISNKNEPTTKYSWLTLFLMVIFTLVVFIVSVSNAINYNKVLDDESNNDTDIGLSRGTVIWFLWLNVVLAIISGFFLIFYIYRVFTNRNVYEVIAISKYGKYILDPSKKLPVRTLDEGKSLICEKIGIVKNNTVDVENCKNFFNDTDTLNDKFIYYLNNFVSPEDRKKIISGNLVSGFENDYCKKDDSIVGCIGKIKTEIEKFNKQ